MNINLRAIETELKAYLTNFHGLDIDESLSGFYEVTNESKLIIYEVQLNKPTYENYKLYSACDFAIDAFYFDQHGKDLGLIHYFDLDCLCVDNKCYKLLMRLEYERTR